MESKYFLLIFLSITLLVVIIGVALMAKGGKLNRKYSNKLMIMRVVLQAVAILITFILFYKSGK